MDENLPEGIISTAKIYKIPIILGGISLLAITVSIVLLVKSVATAAPIEFSDEQTASASSILGVTIIKVDVEGAVLHPGLYSMPEGSRVEDAIAAAGGLSNDVDGAAFAKSINRAMKLVDGGKLYIPSLSSPPLTSPNSPNSLISVNSATENELDSLPGVGPVTAQKIISNRPYQTLEELVSKKTVGTSLFEKIQNQLSL